MVSLGRPGAGEALLAAYGFERIERTVIPCVMEFADPDIYVRAIMSTGPAFEAVDHVGAPAVAEFARAEAAHRVRDGLPLRAAIDVVGYLAVKPV